MNNPYPRRVVVYEVGPRDGLQNEPAAVPVAAKVAFVEALAEAGFPEIEAGAFVRPDRVPQMADTAELFSRIRRRSGTRYAALVPNRRGFEAARAAQVDTVGVFTAASEAFTRKNIGATIAESLERFSDFLPEARAAGIRARGYVSTAWVCPYAGPVPIADAVDVARKLLDLGIDEISMGDTVGAAVPSQVADLFGALAGAGVPLPRLAFHGHDTRGTALANCLAALQTGVATLDASAGGLGGCPYAPGAAGNVATEDLLYMLHGMGIETGVSLEKVVAASRGLAPHLTRPLPSRYLAAVSPLGQM